MSLQPIHASPVLVCVVNPEGTGDPVSVPRGEERGCNTNQVIEDGYPNGQDESCSVHDEDEEHPSAPSEHGMAMEVDALPEEPNEEELSGGMGVQASCDEEIRDSDPIRGFGPDRREGAESRGSDSFTDVEVDDYGKHSVEGCSEALQGICSLAGS